MNLTWSFFDNNRVEYYVPLTSFVAKDNLDDWLVLPFLPVLRGLPLSKSDRGLTEWKQKLDAEKPRERFLKAVLKIPFNRELDPLNMTMKIKIMAADRILARIERVLRNQQSP